MGLRVERIPTLQDSYSYLAICEDTQQAAIVDAAETEPIVLRIEALGVQVTKILCTHHHLDHVGANLEITQLYGIPVYAHHSDAARIPGFTHGIDEGDRISVGNLQVEVLFVPAHTRGHVAYFFPDKPALFCGDTLFVAGCGRLFEGTAAMMFDALHKFAKLPDATEIYCGHEYTEKNLRFAVQCEPEQPALRAQWEKIARQRAGAARDWHDATPQEMTIPSTLREERLWNPFLRARDVKELARLRQLKDQF